MEKWLIKRLLEEKERKKSDSNEYEQTNRKHDNRIYLISGSKPNWGSRERERENCEQKKKNNISSSTVVYFDLNTYGFSACFFHSPNE